MPSPNTATSTSATGRNSTVAEMLPNPIMMATSTSASSTLCRNVDTAPPRITVSVGKYIFLRRSLTPWSHCIDPVTTSVNRFHTTSPVNR